MDFALQLWLPILLSAVFVFIMSSIVHMLLPYHKTEIAPAPNTDGIQNALRGAAPGSYAFPLAPDPKDRMSPEWMKKWAEGPSGFLTVFPPGAISMGRNLALWFVFNLVVSFFAAYVGAHSLSMHGGVTYLSVFRVIGTIGLMAYGFGATGDSIWFGKPWRSWAFTMFDALLYGLVMAGTFGWLWPRA